ncbi:MAG: PIG-L family deacetylase [Nitrospira sp.]|nr:PIG-L family deacetylase [Nitrospira sp.]
MLLINKPTDKSAHDESCHVFNLVPVVRRTASLSVLCLGAHSDDIEIGCGGTILRLLQSYSNCNVTWVVFSASGTRKREAVASAKRFLSRAKTSSIVTKAFKESFFPYRGEEIKAFFEQLKTRVSPDLIFSHYRHDLHQDHRVICELTWNTFRKHQILEYEIPKYDGDLGQPNVYVPLSKELCDAKVRFLMDGFSTQRSRQWFTEDTFYSLLRLRGIESHALDKYAEAFYGRKIVLGR